MEAAEMAASMRHESLLRLFLSDTSTEPKCHQPLVHLGENWCGTRL